MTALLRSVHKGVKLGPFRGLIYGAEKVGKTLFTLGSEAPLVADIEGRVDHLDCESVKVATWQECMDLAEELLYADHAYKTFVVDSITVLEGFIRTQTITDGEFTDGAGKNGADAWGGQWVKTAYHKYWPRFWALMEKLQRDRAMTIWYTAHQDVRTMTDPQGGEGYQRYRPDIGIGSKIGGPHSWLHRVDVALFAQMEDVVRVEKSRGEKDKVRLSTTGRRVARTTHHPAYDAGNSWGLPETIALDYAEFDKGRLTPITPKDVVDRIKALAPQLPADKKRSAAIYVKSNGKNLSKMQGLLASIERVLDEMAEEVVEEAKKAKAATASRRGKKTEKETENPEKK